MVEMQSLADEQRKAGLLLDDGAPVKLNVSLSAVPLRDVAPKEKATVFGPEDEEEDVVKKRKAPLVKLEFSVSESSEQTKERLERIRESVPTDKETLFKSKVRWDGLSDVRTVYFACRLSADSSYQSIIDRKFEPLVKRLMTKYLGDMEEAEDLIMFVLEHLKDHKGPQKLIEGLESVRHEPILFDVL